MLVEFKVANFRSFREQQTLSLVASKDKSHTDNLIECEKFKLLKAAGIYGANASGKSNLLDALKVMEQFVLTSATRMSLGDSIPGIVPFRLDRTSHEKPSSFDIVIIVEGTRYEYGFSATTERVFSEYLRVRRPGKNAYTWFTRKFKKASQKSEYNIIGPLKQDRKILEDKTRENGLLLSRGAELNLKPLAELFLWFRREIHIHDLSSSPFSLSQYTAESIKDDFRFRNQVLSLLKDADLGIDNLAVSEKPAFEIPDDTPREFVEPLTELMSFFQESVGKKEGLKMLSVMTAHTLNDSDKVVNFRLDRDESNGTQRLFALAAPVLNSLDKGKLLVLDEFECSMHPLLTRKLIELFQSQTENKKGAQLVFATHDSTLMSPGLFRRDQVWFTEKNRSNATELFSLYDLSGGKKPRNKEAFERNYLSGRYGGVPKFGPTFEDLEIE